MMKRLVSLALVLSIAIGVLSGCQEPKEHQPWIPVLEDTGFTYLESTVTEALKDLDRASKKLDAGYSAQAQKSLKQTRRWLLKLQHYYLPMTEVRRLVYDADRLYYLKRVEETEGNLDKAKKLLVQIGHTADPSLQKITTEVLLAIDDLVLALENSPGKVPDSFAKLGERINMMLLKGELLLAGATFQDQQ